MTEHEHHTVEDIQNVIRVWDRLQDFIDGKDRVITLTRLEVIRILGDYDDLVEK